MHSALLLQIWNCSRDEGIPFLNCSTTPTCVYLASNNKFNI